MDIEFDPAKRAMTLLERGLDFADAGALFSNTHYTRSDSRKDYGEPRFQTIGILYGRAVFIAWTPRGDARRIISMRYAHEHEAQAFGMD
ncbi:BrnT family toxin [Thermomonas sp.]|uniref:BrnT family toxin n=1 Tax=Thermomonas sp. TaxID=1971895 RepID=UPI0035AD848C